jgi:hypothetical protein
LAAGGANDAGAGFFSLDGAAAAAACDACERFNRSDGFPPAFGGAAAAWDIVYRVLAEEPINLKLDTLYWYGMIKQRSAAVGSVAHGSCMVPMIDDSKLSTKLFDRKQSPGSGVLPFTKHLLLNRIPVTHSTWNDTFHHQISLSRSPHNFVR